MTEVLAGFVGLGVVVAIGYALARWEALPSGADVTLARLTFYAATPALLFRTMASADVAEIFSERAVVSVSTALLLLVLYCVGARLFSSLRGAELTLGALSASYVNAGNLGIPLLVVAVGHAADIAPIVLLQLLVMVPVGFAVLDRQTGRSVMSIGKILLTPLRNPLVIAVALGLLVTAAGVRLPAPVMSPVHLLADMAVPIMLIAFGFSLRGAPLPGQGEVRAPMWAAVAARGVGAPLIAWTIGTQIFDLAGAELLGPVVVASLPTAQNVFVYAMRYGRAVPMVRDTILVSTLVSVPVVMTLVAVIGT
ncbi:AEC family transporter [Bogoriella caseilytica]|uniref:AEC family transporter n=1 Tax=Bogoriella caseilytica TaxID=56055 RepID=A0A3N2BBI2_9MICO|nr:AEC family transporter [Bogoriella caseilytica]ROR72532.1 hypothetical protein EDD31_0884 [Bogoriella caseilytica]